MQKHTEKHAAIHAHLAHTNYEAEKKVDDTLIATIQGIDLFIAQASSLGLGTMARILRNAKEELVYWATELNLHETSADKFINQLLYTNGLFAASDFVERLASPKTKATTLASLIPKDTKAPVQTLVEKLRYPT